MAILKGLKKDELLLVAEELGLNIPENPKMVDLKTLIESSDVFKSDKEFLQSVINCVLEEKNNKVEQDKIKLEYEKIKLEQLNKELELTNAKSKLPTEVVKKSEFDPLNIESLIKSIRTLTIPVPSKSFQSLEKAFKTKNVPEEFKAEILLNILGEKVGNLMVYIKEEELVNYEKIKGLVLKQFQPTPQECLNQFRNARKLETENYVQFAARVTAIFEYYCKLRNVSEFNELCQLIIADQIFNSLDQELMSYISIKGGEEWFRPQSLGRELDLFLSSKISHKNVINPSFRQNKFIRGKFEKKNQKNVTSVFLSDVNETKCPMCYENHVLSFCTKFKQLSVNERIEIVKKHRLCFLCLKEKCSVSRCKATTCKLCKRKHHVLIHFPSSNVNYQNESDRITSPGSGSLLNENARIFTPSICNPPVASTSLAPICENTNSVFAINQKEKNKTIFLSTVKCFIRDGFGVWREIRCLLDVGSMTHLLSRQCADKLQLKKEKVNVLVTCLNDSSICVKNCVNAEISNAEGSFKRGINLLVVERITDLTPVKYSNVEGQIPENINLADDSFYIPGPIDCLLGAEIFYELLRNGQIYSPNSNLIFQNTVFGFVASGSSSLAKSEIKLHCGLIKEGDLNDTLKKILGVRKYGFRET